MLHFTQARLILSFFQSYYFNSATQETSWDRPQMQVSPSANLKVIKKFPSGFYFVLIPVHVFLLVRHLQVLLTKKWTNRLRQPLPPQGAMVG